MPNLDDLLAPYLQRQALLRERLAAYEAAIRKLEMELTGVEQRIEGIKETAAAFDTSKARRRAQAARGRSMSLHWQKMLQIVDKMHDHFSYGDLSAAAEGVGQTLSNDSLRSQMSEYKSRGWVESVGLGAFRLTDSGREASDIMPLKEKASGALAPEADVISGPVGREGGYPPSTPEGSIPSGSTPFQASEPGDLDDDDVPF